MEVTGPQERLSHDVELAAVLIVQGVVRNTVRHAGAHQVHVDVGFEPDGLVLAVTDDGQGFAPDNADVLA